MHNVLPLGAVGAKKAKLLTIKTIIMTQNNHSIQDNSQSLQMAVSDSAFFEGENIIAFDNEAWNKAGKDIGDNSCFYKEAKILKIYFHIPKLYGSSDWCANIQFTDGRISNGHFLSGLRHYH